MSRKTIIFTGGGSGGHLVPAVTLINKLKEEDQFDIIYFGSKQGIESEVIPNLNIKYVSITTGKLRRYFSWENLKDIFKVLWGVVEAFFKMLQFNPRKTLVFSCGGFVSVPVVIAAKLTGKKVYIHEQTTRVGLANKIASKFCDRIYVSFKDSMQFFPKTKVVFSGYPLREECFVQEHHSKVSLEGVDLLSINKPLMFVTGGGNGAMLINELIRENLDKLMAQFFIVHQVGKRFYDEFARLKNDSYLPVAFVNEEMIDLFKLSKVIISRAGAGTVCELMALGKPSLFIPLKIAQKNEQFHNAKAAEQEIGSLVVEEDQLKEVDFLKLIARLDGKRVESHFENGTNFLISEFKKAFN